MADALDYADPRPAPDSRVGKGPYGTYLSNALAVLLANRLSSQFPGILPDEHGRGQESRARTARGFKKLDVNYSTIELGLALGVSLKTINCSTFIQRGSREGIASRASRLQTPAWCTRVFEVAQQYLERR
jgi:hypothetical protein